MALRRIFKPTKSRAKGLTVVFRKTTKKSGVCVCEHEIRTIRRQTIWIRVKEVNRNSKVRLCYDRKAILGDRMSSGLSVGRNKHARGFLER